MSKETVNLYKILIDYEQHFNNLQASYRKLASTWLLAVFGGIGFVWVDIEIGNVEKLWLYKSLLSGLICLGGAMGIILIWNLDLLVYHRLLVASTKNGTMMEGANPELPKLHSAMKSMVSGRVRSKILSFYRLPVIFLILLSGIGIGVYLYNKATPYLYIGILTYAIVMISLWWWMKRETFRKES